MMANQVGRTGTEGYVRDRVGIPNSLEREEVMLDTWNRGVSITPNIEIPQLPKDIIVQILQYLDIKSVGKCSLVCWQWEQLIRSNEALGQGISACQLAYKKQLLTCLNLAQGVCQRRDFIGRQCASSFVIVGKLLLFSCRTFTVTILDLNSYEQTAFLCSSRVSTITAGGELLFCGCWDGSVEIWHIPSKAYVATLSAPPSHTSVTSILLAGRAVFVGYWSGRIAIWDVKFSETTQQIEQIKQKATLQDDRDGVTALVFVNRRLCSCSCDGVKIWDLRSQKFTPFLQERNGGVSSLAVGKDGTLFCGYFNGIIEIWKEEFSESIVTLKAHDGVVTCLHVVGEVFFSSCEDEGIKIWNSKSYQHIATLKNKDGNCVGSFVFFDGKLVTCFSRTLSQFDFTEKPSDQVEEVSKQSKGDLDKD
jgi:WD40 repeat protein